MGVWGNGVGWERLMLSGGQGRRQKGGFVGNKTERCGASPSTQRIRVRESRFMRPLVENEVEFRKPRAFRRLPLVHHIGDSAKCCLAGCRKYLARVAVVTLPAISASRAARWWPACGWPENRSCGCA